LLALAAAIVVHPTNVFIAPVVVIGLAVAWRTELEVLWRTPLRLAMVFGLTTAVLMLAGLHEQSRLPEISNRLADPANYVEALSNLGRFFSGVTSYQYVAGSLIAPSSEDRFSGPMPFDLAMRVIAFIVAFGILGRIAQTGSPIDEDVDKPPSPETATPGVILALAFGGTLSVAAFFVVAGPAAIAPHFERYGMFMIGPAAILAALAVEWWRERGVWIGRFATALCLVCGWAILAGFNANFFDFIERTGGGSHETFRTAAIEPKQAALDYIRGYENHRGLSPFAMPGEQKGTVPFAASGSRIDMKSPVEIRTSEWWLYWPLRYLSFATGTSRPISIEVVNSSPEVGHSQSRGHSGVWQVEFSESPAVRPCER
jgi:hypothetical protein